MKAGRRAGGRAAPGRARALAVAAVAALLGVTRSAADVGALGVELGAGVAAVRGVTPGGSLAWISLSRGVQGYDTRVAREEALLLDDDGDGQVAVALAEGVPHDFIGVAVDVASGAVAAAVPAGSSDLPVPLSSYTLKADGSGGLSLVETPREQIELLLVRAGAGAWGGSAGDGAEGDLSAGGPEAEPDGTLLASLASLQPLGASGGAPAGLDAQDVLVVIDPRSFEYAVGRPVTPGGAQ